MINPAAAVPGNSPAGELAGQTFRESAAELVEDLFLNFNSVLLYFVVAARTMRIHRDEEGTEVLGLKRPHRFGHAVLEPVRFLRADNAGSQDNSAARAGLNIDLLVLLEDTTFDPFSDTSKLTRRH